MKEIWRDIPGFEGLYQASSLGGIRSLDRFVPNKTKKTGLQRRKGQQLRSCISASGYCVVNLSNKTYFTHRLVARAFYGDIQPGFSVNHINGNKIDNRVVNLEIVTHSNNCKHAYDVLKRQPSCKGQTNTGASKPVLQIDNLRIISVYPSAREAERITGINHKHISSCCHGKRHTAGGFSWVFSSFVRLVPHPYNSRSVIDK